MIAHCRVTDAARELGVDEAFLLRALSTFGTLSQHAEQLRATIELSEAQARALPELLGRSHEQGLLISAAELLARFSAAAGPYTPPPPISTLAIVACDRPHTLFRALTSYVRNVHRAGRQCDFAVFDDGRRPEGRAEHRARLRQIGQQEGAAIHYAGEEEKRRFADALAAESGVADTIVAFALWGMPQFGNTVGANRNAVLLHTVGELLLSFDDDTVCEVAAPPMQEPGLRLAPGGISAWEHWFCADRADAQRIVIPADRDVLAMHEEVLGGRFDACIVNASGTTDFGRMPAALLGHVLANLDGRILASMNGLFGVSGYGAPLLTLRGDSLGRLVATERGYRSALASPEVVRAVPTLTLSMGAAVAGGFLGLDNRELLPPFMPVCRGEDTVFGALLQELYPGSMQAFLPWLLLHSPPHAEAQRYPENAFLMDALGLRMPRLMLAVLSHLRSPRLFSGASRLRAIGAALAQLAGQPAQDFAAELRAMVLRSVGQELCEDEELLAEQARSPTFWAADVTHYRQVATRQILRPEYIVPVELRAGRSDAEALFVLQQALRQLGQLLDAWPALVLAARRLRARGELLAKAV